jgi:hypothetical protein
MMNQRQRGDETPSRGSGLSDHAKKKLEEHRRARDSQQQGARALSLMSPYIFSNSLRIQGGFQLAMKSVPTLPAVWVIFRSDLIAIRETVDMIVSSKHPEPIILYLEMGGTQLHGILLTRAATGVVSETENGMQQHQEHQDSAKTLTKMQVV